MNFKRSDFRAVGVEPLESRFLLSVAYHIVDLGVLPGGSSSAAYALNQIGVVVGNALLSNGNTHGFEFTNGMVSDIGTLPGGATTHAYSINSQGDITGETLQGGFMHAFFDSHGVMRDLGTLGGHSSFAYAVNDDQTVVGGSFLPGDKVVHAFIWTPATKMKDLGTLGGGFSIAYAINAAGKIAGYSTNSRGRNDMFLYDGRMHDLGVAVGASRSIAYGISVWGVIVGAETVGNNEHAFDFAGGMFSDLGTLGGSSSSAYGINHAGTIVGISTIKGSNATHAFEYRAGKMFDLNAEISHSDGWTLLGASAVNDAGQIAGWGMIDGHIHGFLLNPL